MKNPKNITKKTTPKTKKTEKPAKSAAKAEKSVKAVAAKAIPKKTGPKKSPPKKVQTVASSPAVATGTMTISDRIGSTAGNIWHHLTDNGTCSVASLFREINEDEKIIQRSIGWLAQEGKIILDTTDRTEMIALK